MRVSIAQLQVGRSVAANLAKIQALVRAAQPDEWIACPEGALSGYFPQDESFLSHLDADEIDRAIQVIGDEVRRARCHCVFGTAMRADGTWRNVAIAQSHTGDQAIYVKRGLSRLDVRHFTPGSDLPVWTIGGVTIGMQLCRELILPAPWIELKSRGVQVVFHVNNAINPHDRVWEHLVIARALEFGIFVCSVNNAAAPQALTSYLVDPGGHVVLAAERQTEQVLTQEIDLRAVIPILEARQDF